MFWLVLFLFWITYWAVPYYFQCWRLLKILHSPGPGIRQLYCIGLGLRTWSKCHTAHPISYVYLNPSSWRSTTQRMCDGLTTFGPVGTTATVWQSTNLAVQGFTWKWQWRLMEKETVTTPSTSHFHLGNHSIHLPTWEVLGVREMECGK